jgi:HK97 gp10 family phage protein
MSSLRKKIKRLEPEARQGIKDAMTEVADEILAEAKSRVPVDTGTLKKKLTRQVSRDGMSAKVGVRTKAAKRKAYYGKFIELGTSKMPAQPFLTPAFEVVRPKAKVKLKKEIDATLTKVALGG